MYVHRSASEIVVHAPAKLNLFFEVLARRGDGYHQIETFIYPIDLYDTLYFRRERSGRLDLAVEGVPKPAGEGDRGREGEPLGALPETRKNLVWRTVDEAWMILYLARAMQDSTLPLFELATWFQACQYWDGGFRFLPHTTSFIENCHTCLRALALLGIKPLDLSGAYRFILVSHTASGGLSRNSRATPFLDATCHAIAGIALIQSFEAA